MRRATFMCGSALMVLGTVLLSGCAAPGTAETQQTEDTPHTAAHPEQALLENLVVANRMLARELDILDIQGHVTARSRVNPNHYYIARFVSPGGASISDFIENDLDSNPVHGPRTDQAREIYLHGEIYKARPDVNAVLYARTPEIVAFTEASARLRPVVNGGAFIGGGLPLFDMSSLDPGKPILAHPALGRGVAAALGKARAVLLTGHGFVLTAGSIYNLVDQAYQLRLNAVIQRQAIALRGRVASLNEQPVQPVQPNEAQQPAPTGPAEGRSWIYWSQNVSLD